MRTVKYLITVDRRHFKSETEDHYLIAEHNGLKPFETIEYGLIVDSKVIVLECSNERHLNKIKTTEKYILNEVNRYENILKARTAETLYKYNCYSKEGD